MNMHRVLFAVVIGCGAPAMAQEAAPTELTATPEAAPVQPVTPEAASLFAPAPAAQALLVPVNGVVSGTPESVTFSGSAKVASRLARDPDFNRPRLVLRIDLRDVSAVGASGAKYAIFGPELVAREVAASHTVEFTFPFKASSAASGATARTGVASFALDFDTATGGLTGASGGVSTPNFPQ